MPSFVSEAIRPAADTFDTAPMSRGEPSLPTAFEWRDETLVLGNVLRTWRSTKVDRGDTYLARHWFEVALADGRKAVIYFERHARASQARWWLYTIEPSP